MASQTKSSEMMLKVIGWTIVVGFLATTLVTLLAITNVIQLAKDEYLDRLFVAVVLEFVAVGIYAFKTGILKKSEPDDLPEHAYFERANTLLNKALKEKESGNLEEADRLLGEILRLSVDDLPFEIRQVFRERGSLAFTKKLWMQASNAYGTYYEIDPDDLEVLVQYGRSLREMDRYSEALEVYERAEKLSPNNYDVLNGMQNVTRRMGGFFQEADLPDVSDGYFEKARGYIAGMLRIAPDKETHERRYLNALLARARLYWQWERRAEAIHEFQEVMKEFPDFSPVREDLAAVLLEEGEAKANETLIQQAHQIYKDVFSKAEDDETKVFSGAGLAEASALLPNPDQNLLFEARAAAVGALAKFGSVAEDPYPFYAAAVLFQKLGEEEDARKYLREAIRHERRRAADPYRFDYVRLVKYEKLLQRWDDARDAT